MDFDAGFFVSSKFESSLARADCIVARLGANVGAIAFVLHVTRVNFDASLLIRSQFEASLASARSMTEAAFLANLTASVFVGHIARMNFDARFLVFCETESVLAGAKRHVTLLVTNLSTTILLLCIAGMGWERFADFLEERLGDVSDFFEVGGLNDSVVGPSDRLKTFSIDAAANADGKDADSFLGPGFRGSRNFVLVISLTVSEHDADLGRVLVLARVLGEHFERLLHGFRSQSPSGFELDCLNGGFQRCGSLVRVESELVDHDQMTGIFEEGDSGLFGTDVKLVDHVISDFIHHDMERSFLDTSR